MNLSAGRHVLQFKLREAGTQLDAVKVLGGAAARAATPGPFGTAPVSTFAELATPAGRAVADIFDETDSAAPDVPARP